jgi:hypothetical protein
MEGKKLWLCSKEMPKAQVWVVVEVITSCLNPIVSTCVMNQSKGHWLFSNTLTTTIALTIYEHGSNIIAIFWWA